MSVIRIVKGGFQIHKSDENKYIKKVGTQEVYSEAIDRLEADYTYEETDEKIIEIYGEEV